jgi:O-antigen/teichoic acid export membrane protein
LKSDSLTKQATFLMAGRFLAMPLTFLVPIVLVRVFSVEEFGIYKQLFMIFYILLPVIDLGISQSLFYFIPKYQEQRDSILSQTFLLQVPIIVGLSAVFFVFSTEIGALFSTDGESLGNYIPLLGIFVLLWHLSNIFENLLIVEKKAFQAGAVTFFSETARALVSIAIGLAGGSLTHLLWGLVGTSILRCLVMGWYLKSSMSFSFSLKTDMLRSQIFYSIPFGLAVIVNTFMLFSHQYIVSVAGGPAEFAIYAVGCFSLPVIAIVIDSVAKASLVRMSEAARLDNSAEIISEVIHNSIRKLWILFFPVFVFLFIMAEEFIIILFTESYNDSIPVFRVFILMIPLSALLVQHVPRALSATRFILVNNVIALLLSVALCMSLFHFMGLIGAAAGFIAANLLWRILFLLKCGSLLQVSLMRLLPLKSMTMVTLTVLLIGGAVYLMKQMCFTLYINSFIFSSILYGLLCMILYWFGHILLNDEKKYIKIIVEKYIKIFFYRKIT